jgi:L-2-hydroxycarboxylate dehydrogenase (NAD+)
MLLTEPEARDTATRALSKVAPADHAATQIDLLLEADLRGVPSHGMLRLPRIIARIASGATDPASSGTHAWRGEAFLAVDGGRGLGPVVAERAIAVLSERVRRTGVAVAAISNSNHIGMLGYYAEKAARAGSTMIALTTSEALVHPWGGRQAMLGTNPIAIGVPTGGEPFMMDTATSVVSMGEIHDHANRGVPIPDHWAVDADGNPTTDPVAARGGAIAPFGQAKGYALGLAFEMLVTSLSGSAIGRDVRGTLDDTSVCSKGDVFILLDGPRPDLQAYLDSIRTAEPAAGFDRVLVPGERGRATKRQRLIEGVPIADEVWTRIQQLADA